MKPLTDEIVSLTTLALVSVSVLAPAQKGWPRGPEQATSNFQLHAAPALYDLNGDGKLEIIVPRMDDKLYVYKHDGTPFIHTDGQPSSYPVTLGFLDGTFSSPAVGDVDGDGFVEIVIAGDNREQRNASIKVFEIDGTLAHTILLHERSNASGKATPCLIDTIRFKDDFPDEAHPAKEILFRDGDGLLHVIQWNGSSFIDRSDTNTSNYRTTNSDSQKDRAGRQFITPSVSAKVLSHIDISTETNVDIATETYVVVPSTDGRVHHWIITSASASGQTYQLTKLTPLETGAGTTPIFTSSAALADFDGDNEIDVVAGASNGEVYVWHGSNGGALRTGWPQITLEGISGSPALADLDNNGVLDIIVGSEDSWVYAWNTDGTALPGWPFETRGDILASPVVANLDGNDSLEVIIASADRSVYVVSSTGELWEGWPKRLDSTLYSSPAVGNLRKSGKASLLIGEYDGMLYCFDLPYFIGVTGNAWNQFRGGPARTGAK